LACLSAVIFSASTFVLFEFCLQVWVWARAEEIGRNIPNVKISDFDLP
jgi:hypothetical protein